MAKAIAPVAASTSISARALAAQSIGEINGVGFSVKKQVIVPLLKQANGEKVFIRITSAIYEGKAIKEADPTKGPAKERPFLCKVVNLQDGKPYEYIVNAIVKSRLMGEEADADYQDGGYVGRSFAINKLPPDKGKRANNFEFFEIEPTAPAETVAE